MSELASFLSQPRTALLLADDERQYVNFMDSSGRHLIEALRRCTSEQGGALVLVVATSGVRRLLGIAPPPSHVQVVVVGSQRDAAVRNQRLSPHSGRTVAA